LVKIRRKREKVKDKKVFMLRSEKVWGNVGMVHGKEAKTVKERGEQICGPGVITVEKRGGWFLSSSSLENRQSARGYEASKCTRGEKRWVSSSGARTDNYAGG